MNTLKTNTNLTLKLLTTNKAFICYNLNENKTHIDSYVLTNDLYRYKNRYQSFKAISCIKKQFNTITF
jgi:hypothetical protein